MSDDARPVFARENQPTVGLSQKHISIQVWIAGCMFEIFLYGMYIILFVVCINLLLKNKSPFKWTLFLSAVIMFTISTTSAIMTVYIFFTSLTPGSYLPPDIAHPKYLFYVVNNVIADCLLIYRCYAAWCNSKRIITLPCILLLASALSGLVFNGAPEENMKLRSKNYISLWLTLALNVLVTVLTATRIWWMARKTSKILGSGLARKYYSAIAIIVESGALYSLYVLLDLVVKTFILDCGLTQVVAIVPTLIIVQVGLGRHARDVDTTISMARGEVPLSPVSQPNHSPLAINRDVVDVPAPAYGPSEGPRHFSHFP